MSVRCKFCIYFGRESNIRERKRQQTDSIKVHFAFRVDHYKSHLEGQHSVSWKTYQELSTDEKRTYFDNRLEFKNTLLAHFQCAEVQQFVITANIVETIIGDIFFHPDDYGGVTHQAALKLFTKMNDGNYTINIKNALQFKLIVEYVAVGLSFNQASKVLAITKRHTGLGTLGNVNDTGTGNYIRAVCAINLQLLSKLLSHRSTWAFSLAHDASTHWGKSYFDNRIRLHFNGCLYNIHVIAIPMFEEKSAVNIFNVVKKVLGILCSDWPDKLLGMGSDGEPTMTGHLGGVLTLIQQQVPHKIYRIWCSLHQLDLVMRHAYMRLVNGEVLTIMNSFITHLRQQHT